MDKYRVFFNNYKGNYYSFFVKSDTPDGAIHQVYNEKVKELNIDLSDYDICVANIRMYKNWKQGG